MNLVRAFNVRTDGEPRKQFIVSLYSDIYDSDLPHGPTDAFVKLFSLVIELTIASSSPSVKKNGYLTDLKFVKIFAEKII